MPEQYLICGYPKATEGERQRCSQCGRDIVPRVPASPALAFESPQWQYADPDRAFDYTTLAAGHHLDLMAWRASPAVPFPRPRN